MFIRCFSYLRKNYKEKKFSFPMKITIDTKEDSKEEIRKLIQMLSSLLGEEVKINQEASKDLFSSEEGNKAFFNMFSDTEPKAESEKKEAKDEEEREEIPSVVSY